MPKVRLIDANALKNDMQKYFDGIPVYMPGVFRVIERAPTIEPKVRRGRWIPTEYDSYADGNPVYDAYECSECGHEHNGEEDTLTAFCPDCGARMDGKE